ncbi:MAG: ribonuclease HIII [Planctomycetes bacterium]|nr:ribonuclease HIII [Planctomycetota bacterium]
MSQRTEVFRFPVARAEQLRRALVDAGFEERPLAHAFFQARGEGVIASLYRSGKLVVQGEAADGFAARFLGGAVPEPGKKKGACAPDQTDVEGLLGDRMGSDEAGKGDSFGGLAVAAGAVGEGGLAELLETGVADSKALSDERVRALAPWIRDHCVYAERVLSPAEYNEAHRAAGSNVNTLLALLHAEVILEVADACGYSEAVVDRFSPREPVREALSKARPGLRVIEIPRAEAVPAVAAASVLAREAFIRQMENMGNEWAHDFPLGSGAPVPPALRKFLKLHGRPPLGKVAKLHFANVRKIADSLPWD